jgi:hypothetical protein
MPASNRDAAEATPYASAAVAYLDAGWQSPLPVPARTKRIAVVGWTGRHGMTPSRADVEAWREDQPHANIALRLPPDILGVDVDNYSNKTGGATLAECERQWGPLPATWRSTSRDDGISGIRLFLVPPGLDWPGQLPGGGVETIHSAHRYLVAPPSLHPEGRTYRWIDPAGQNSLAIPSPTDADLARLPLAWIEHLPRGIYQEEAPSLDMPRGEIASWLAAVPATKDAPCPLMAKYVLSATTGMVAASSRHERLLTSLLQIVRFGESGHTGLAHAIREVRQAFLDAVRLDKSRTESEANAEAERALAGAVAKVAASPSEPGTGDPCAVMAHTFAKAAADKLLAKVKAAPPYAPGGLIHGPLDPPELPPAQPSPMGLLLAREFGTAPTVVPEPEPVIVDERTSWAAADIEMALLGKQVEGPPTVLARSDGMCLLYGRRINGVIGPSESGKTWLALEAVRQVLMAGHRVIYTDFEDTVPGVVGRLLALDVPPSVLRSLFVYIGPTEPLAPVQMADLMVELARVGEGDLIVLDGFNAAMTLQGLNLMENKDVTMFYQQLMSILLSTLACVVYVDHTPKNDAEGDSRGGIGAQAKRAMTTGTILRCDIKTPFGRDQTGYIAILADKDRSGHVRAVSPGRKVGTAKLDSTTDDNGVNRVSLVIELSAPPETAHTATGADYSRPTFLMRRVSDYLATHPGASGSTVRTEVSGKDTYVIKALAALVIEGYVETTPGPRNALLHTLAKPYLESLDPFLNPPVPTRSPPVPGTGQKGSSPVPQNPGTKSPGYGNRLAIGSQVDDATGSQEQVTLFEDGDDV